MPRHVEKDSTRRRSSRDRRRRDREPRSESRESYRWPRKSLIFGVAIFGFGLGSVLDIKGANNRLRRSLSEMKYLESHSTLLPWAHYNLKSVHEKPDPSQEVGFFWHIPKSGGTTAKRLYQCLGQTLANRAGGDKRYGHHEDEEIIVFNPFVEKPETKYVNVDVTSRPGILRAERLGLVASKKVDMIFTSDVSFAIDHLFDRTHKGRVFALFRHPVERSISKFYYLQIATWERTYRPEWKNITVLEWATKHNVDENFMVKKILGKQLKDTVDMGDLIIAKEIVRRRFIVGLMDKMEESIKRFNIMLGINESHEKTKMCMEEFFGTHDDEKAVEEKKDSAKQKSGNADEGENEDSDNEEVKKTNSNKHPKIAEDTPEWELLAERNSLDVILYNYILLLYDEQKDIIESYKNEGLETETATE